MPSKMERKLGNMLFEEGIISLENLERAYQRGYETSQSIEIVLLQMKLLSTTEMVAALVRLFQVPFISIDRYLFDGSFLIERQALEAVPEEIARRYDIMPLDKAGNTLTIAFSGLSWGPLVREIMLLTECQIIPVISLKSDIRSAIDRHYGKADDSR